MIFTSSISNVLPTAPLNLSPSILDVKTIVYIYSLVGSKDFPLTSSKGISNLVHSLVSFLSSSFSLAMLTILASAKLWSPVMKLFVLDFSNKIA